jgi:hypothetical protein
MLDILRSVAFTVDLPGNTGNGEAEKQVNGVISYVFITMGIIAVAMVIVGAIQYTTSAGSPDKVARAKNTIMYSVLGLLVIIMAFSIVTFVVSGVGV